ncbi:hypothetical protein [Microcystis aeruginosa]|uniref:hypothetical protein n=1 Tax=Microcystis aeruginosa TaxID=1126 RepID=UPI001390A26B|nr:hypothetical protein [Microcystis aeruginosa]
MPIVFNLERANQLSLLPDKDLAYLCPLIEPYQPTFRTLSVTTSQKRKGRESKYLSRGVSWRQAAGN